MSNIMEQIVSIFQKSVINKYLKNLDKAKLDKAFGNYKDTFTAEKIEIIKSVKEEEYQDGFLRDLFVNVLGYKLNIDSKEHDLVREKKNQTDAKKADGAIIKDGKVTAVIELKDTKTKDMGSFTEQAFGYKNSQEGCKYVITSNFHKLRFYIDNKVDFEEFNLFELGRDDFELLYLILNKESIFSDIPAKLKEETKFHEETVSNKLYSDYSSFKKNLFSDMTNNNPQYDKLTLFKKSQKLIDRFLFILFAEDRGLLPPNSTARMITRFDVLKSEDSYKPLYDICRQYFGYMNTGNQKENIPAYNGGLFLPDDILDSLKISDGILRDHLWKLSSYDYVTEIDVNILGHIFEHSLSEIEEITAEIEGIKTDKAKSKRKKDGVYYTPKYITQYIVEHTVGTLCREKRKELGIETIEFDEKAYRKTNGFLTEKGKELFSKLEAYKVWLFSLKILDPACGSGAFLIQALNFLIQEHKTIDDIIAELTGSPLRLFDTDKTILENNLYGVDINDESVEIAKLSLWLHTARKDRKLSDLNNNIKCGNSLIDDPKVAGDKAFDWHKEFKDIMQAGGFDAVIGNPPYVRQELIKNKEYLNKKYITSNASADLYIYFYELGYNVLRSNGLLGFISSNKFTRTSYAEKLRGFLSEKTKIINLLNFGESQFFEGATTYTAILTFRKTKPCNKEKVLFFELKERLYITDVNTLVFQYGNHVNSESFTAKEWTFEKENVESLINKINNTGSKLKTYIKDNVYRGVLTGYNDAFVIDEKTRQDLIAEDINSNEIIKPLLIGRNIGRYFFERENKYLIFTRRGINIENYKAIKKYLLNFYDDLKPKQVGDVRGRKPGSYSWYEIQDVIAYYAQFEKPKIIYANMAQSNRFVMDLEGFYTNQKCFIIPLEDYHLLAVLNSKLIYFIVKNKFPKLLGNTYEFTYKNFMENLPIANVNEAINNKITPLAKIMHSLNKQLQEKMNKFQSRIKSNFALEKISTKLESFHDHDFKTFLAELKKQKVSPTLKQQDEWEEYFNEYKKEINDLQAEIRKTDAEIDQMVYKLYELTDEEIKVVEGSL